MLRCGFNVLFLFIFSFLSIAFLSREATAAQPYLPVGPQTDVPVATVTGGGWTECYRDTYNVQLNADEVLAQCPGALLMLSCSPVGSGTLTVLAQAAREDVTFDTGNDNTDVVHVANGSGWYFNNTGGGSEGLAWGFVMAGDSVEKDNCDVDSSGADDERLCWHLDGGGYRCGVTQDLNGSTDFERIVYVSNATFSTTAIPTLSEWGLIAMAGILGISGLLIARRRKAAV